MNVCRTCKHEFAAAQCPRCGMPVGAVDPGLATPGPQIIDSIAQTAVDDRTIARPRADAMPPAVSPLLSDQDNSAASAWIGTANATPNSDPALAPAPETVASAREHKSINPSNEAWQPPPSWISKTDYSQEATTDPPTRPAVNMKEAVRLLFKNYTVFYGRASRSEYWYIVLLHTLIIVGFYLIEVILISLVLATAPELWGFVSFLIGLLTFAVCVWVVAASFAAFTLSIRRLHDGGNSGWSILWGFVPVVGSIILIIMYASASNPEGARFDDPSGRQPASI